jgi:cephalosporin hydroxylase
MRLTKIFRLLIDRQIGKIKIMVASLLEKFWFFFFPLIAIKIKKFKFENLEDLVSFSFNFWWGLIRPMQIKEELIEFLKILHKMELKRIIEIGTAKGGMIFLFSKIVSRDAKIISIDLPKGPFGGGYSFLRILLYKLFIEKDKKIYFLRMNSHDEKTLKKVEKILNGKKVDLLFIDGDHTYDGVKKDFEMYKKFVKKGGFIVFHDITSHIFDEKVEVYKFWNEIKNNFETDEISFKSNTGSYGIGIIKYENRD